MPLKVCLLSDHHVCINPRLWKEAFFYEKQGYDVVILAMWQSKLLLQKDLDILRGHKIGYQCYLNLIPGEIQSGKRLFYRLRKRAAGELQRFFKISTSKAISYAPERMIKKALELNADLYAAHLECAFFAGRDLIKAGKKVSFDFEDWYSRDYLVPERPVRLLATLEKYATEHGLFCTAASGSMAKALEKCYEVKKKFTVIYNGFSVSETAHNSELTSVNNRTDFIKLLWFSRTIGPDRGIEYLLPAIALCKMPVELHLLGDMAAGYKDYLDNNFPFAQGHHLVLHPFIPHDRLSAFIAQFRIGLAIEENINDNRNLTITNKVLQYLQAGLSVIASGTEGQKEVANYFPEAVSLVDIKNPSEIADAIVALAARRTEDRQIQSDAFKKIFSWEVQEKKLKRLLEINL